MWKEYNSVSALCEQQVIISKPLISNDQKKTAQLIQKSQCCPCRFTIYHSNKLCFCFLVGIFVFFVTTIALRLLSQQTISYFLPLNFSSLVLTIAIWVHFAVTLHRRWHCSALCHLFFAIYFFIGFVLMDSQWWSPVCNETYLNQCRSLRTIVNTCCWVFIPLFHVALILLKYSHFMLLAKI